MFRAKHNQDERCKSCNGADHPDHQDAIVSERLKLVKISSVKAEQKQAVVGVLNTDAQLTLWFCSRSLGGLWFFLRTLKISINYAFSVVDGLAVIASTSATTGFKLAFKKRASSTAF